MLFRFFFATLGKLYGPRTGEEHLASARNLKGK